MVGPFMKIPNFFIIGAPKCGTTSLAAWLAEHPQIHMSPVKEPHHFNTDQNYLNFPNRSDYERLFLDANEGHRAVGEASVWYLYSRVAVPNIEQYAPGARYVVCLRNPVEMAYSLHEQKRVSGSEHIEDFVEAWNAQQARQNGENVSRWCWEPTHLAYGAVCSLGRQLERLYRQVPRERVLPLVLDDFGVDARQVYRSVLSFLNVDDDGRTEFSVWNPAKERRSWVLRRAVLLMGSAKRQLGIKRGLGVLNAIDRSNIRYRPRPPMSYEMRKTLQNYFRADVKKLSGLLNRDLSHWVEE